MIVRVDFFQHINAQGFTNFLHRLVIHNAYPFSAIRIIIESHFHYTIRMRFSKAQQKYLIYFSVRCLSSIGGRQQISLRGGCQSPTEIYALRECAGVHPLTVIFFPHLFQHRRNYSIIVICRKPSALNETAVPVSSAIRKEKHHGTNE